MKEFLYKRALTSVFEVTGKGIPLFLNRILRAGVTVLRLKYKGNSVYLTIPRADSKKLFAICGELCYNIIISDKNNNCNNKNKRVSVQSGRVTLRYLRAGGYLAPAVSFFTRIGLAVGLAIFLLLVITLDNLLLGVTMDAVPIAHRGSVRQTLKESGIKKYTPFSAIDEGALSVKIVEDNPALSFVTVYKKGSFLVVEALTAEAGEQKGGQDIHSDVDGVIEKISVFRGTPLVALGQEVSVGQALVGGYFMAGEERIKTTALAEIYVRSNFVFAFECARADDYYVASAIAVAKDKCPFSNIIEVKTDVTEMNEGYKITVVLTYVKLIGG